MLDVAPLGNAASWAGAGIIPRGNPDRAATPYDKLRAVSSAALPHFSAELDDRTGIDALRELGQGAPQDRLRQEAGVGSGVRCLRFGIQAAGPPPSGTAVVDVAGTSALRSRSV